jgi:hypothetical protein
VRKVGSAAFPPAASLLNSQPGGPLTDFDVDAWPEEKGETIFSEKGLMILNYILLKQKYSCLLVLIKLVNIFETIIFLIIFF